MNTRSLNIFNKHLVQNEMLFTELQNTNEKKTFIEVYVKAANKFLSENGYKTISTKEIENSLLEKSTLHYEELNDFQMSSSSAHTQSSCTTSTSAGCSC